MIISDQQCILVAMRVVFDAWWLQRIATVFMYPWHVTSPPASKHLLFAECPSSRAFL
jgi:hypothetical protein